MTYRGHGFGTSWQLLNPIHRKISRRGVRVWPDLYSQEDGGPSVNRTPLYYRSELVRFVKILWETVLRETDSSMSNDEFIGRMSNLPEVAILPWVVRPTGKSGWRVNPSYVEVSGNVQSRVRLFRSWNGQMRQYLGKSNRSFERNLRHGHGLFI